MKVPNPHSGGGCKREGGLRGLEEDLEGLVPSQSQRQVPTHPIDSLPWKSCPNLGDDTQTSQPQTLKYQQCHILPTAQRGKLRPREGQGQPRLTLWGQVESVTKSSGGLKVPTYSMGHPTHPRNSQENVT